MVIDLKTHPRLKDALREAIKYRKHKAFVTIAETVELHPSSWDGGSRTDTWLMTPWGDVAHVPNMPQSQWPKRPESLVYTLQPGKMVLKSGTFRGKTAIAHVYMTAEDAVNMEVST